MSITSLFINLSIRNKITGAFLVVLLLVAVSGFASVDRLAALNRTVTALTSDSLVAIDELGEMRDAVMHYRLAVARYMAAKDLTPEFAAGTEKALANYRAMTRNMRQRCTAGTNRFCMSLFSTPCRIILRP